MKTKKTYILPVTLLISCNTDNILQQLSKTGTESKGDNTPTGPEEGGDAGEGGGITPSKEHHSWNVWDDDDWGEEL